MAYTPMTAEQYVVDELQNSKFKIRSLEEDVKILKNELDATNDVLNRMCKKLVLNYSIHCGNYISWDLMPTERNDPELYAELKGE